MTSTDRYRMCTGAMVVLDIFQHTASEAFMPPNSFKRPMTKLRDWLNKLKVVNLKTCFPGSEQKFINMAATMQVSNCVLRFVVKPLIFNISPNIYLTNTGKFTNFNIEIQ